VTSAQFQPHVEQAAGAKVQGFFEYWLNRPGLPSITLAEVRVELQGTGPATVSGPWRPAAGQWTVVGEVRRAGGGPPQVVVEKQLVIATQLRVRTQGEQFAASVRVTVRRPVEFGSAGHGW